MDDKKVSSRKKVNEYSSDFPTMFSETFSLGVVKTTLCRKDLTDLYRSPVVGVTQIGMVIQVGFASLTGVTSSIRMTGNMETNGNELKSMRWTFSIRKAV